MKSRKMFLFVFGLLSLFTSGIFLSNNAFASDYYVGQDLSSKISYVKLGSNWEGCITADGSHTCFNLAQFDNTFPSYELSEQWHCMSAGKDLAWYICDDDTTATVINIEDGFVYVRVNFYSCNRSDQDVTGVIRFKDDSITYHTLSGKSVNTNGVAIGSDPESKKVVSGQPASIARKNLSGYVFKGWAKSIPSGGSYTIASTSSTYSVSSLTADTTVYAVYEASFFEGQSQVTVGDSSVSPSSSNTTSAGFTGSGGTSTREIPCSASGCDVTFRHHLRRTQGTQGTRYKITHTINDGSGTKTIINTTTENFLSDSTIHPSTQTYNLKPGYKICEKLSFIPSSLISSYVSTEVCALATGSPTPGPDPTPTPDDPSGNGTAVDIKVKNDNIDAYKNYSDGTIYAKPNDKICFEWSYNPVLQYTAKLIPDGISIDSGPYIANSGNQNLQDLYNASHSSSLQNWNNAFMISYANFSAAFSSEYNYPQTIGNVIPVSKTDQCGSGVSSSQAGKTITGTISTNTNSSISTTPKNVTYSSGNIANIDTSEAKDTAEAEVPYNFNTEVSVTPRQEIVYAGESDSVTPDVRVTKRYNATTEGDYATKVDNAKIQVIFYEGAAKSGNNNWGNASSDPCDYFGGDCVPASAENDKTLNQDGGIEGSRSSEATKTDYNIPDVAAGTTYCLAVAVYPSNSGYDTNMNPSGSDFWNVSDSKCVTVAKKPSFQVWGGNIYSEKTIDVNMTLKNNLDGYIPFRITGGSDKIAFGSWGELGLITTQQNNGLASGAATGYSDVEFAANPGGKNVSTSTNPLSSLLSPLSIINPSSASSASASTGVLNYTSSRESFIMSFISGADKTILGSEVSNSGIIAEKVLATHPNTLYTYSTTDSVIGNKFLPVVCGTDSEGNSIICNTHVIYSEGNITITDNIEYEDKTYTSEADIPKFIIYAKGNINIQCSVSNIDAWLISEGDVDTCSDADDKDNGSKLKNAEKRSNPLTIFGSIIASNLYLNRTYGAGTGDNSIVPAEIINYDSTIYYLTDDEDRAASSDTSAENNRYNLKEAYLRELSPRY